MGTFSNVGTSEMCSACEFDQACKEEEKALRHYAYYGYATPMTAEQRAWCIEEASRFEECDYTREELETIADKDLAYAVLRVWTVYCRSQGLI